MKWMRYKYFYLSFSLIIIIAGLFALLTGGLKPAIDFTGGSLLEIKFETSEGLDNEKIQNIVSQKKQIYSVQKSGDSEYLLRMESISKDEADEIKQILGGKLNTKTEEIRFETIGPTLGRELLTKTIIGVVLAAGLIMFYVAWQFKDSKFGVCAVLAMLHDGVVLLGIFALLGKYFSVEVDSLFVTAMLTILSFSVHDTIVVYDRIRESQKIFPNGAFVDLVNKSITETLSRSLNNSLTVIFMLIALVLLGGVTTKWFALALLVGVISGTYSSTFTAAPLLVIWNLIEQKRKKISR